MPGPYIHLAAGVRMCNPSSPTARWEMGTGESTEDGRPARPAYAPRNKNFYPKQGGKQGLTPKAVY